MIEKYTEDIIFFDEPAKSDMRAYDYIQTITTGQGDYCTIDCLLDYNYFNQYFNVMAIDLSKQQAIDSDPKAIYSIKFTGNLEQHPAIFFIIEEAKETVLDFWQGTVEVL